MVAHLKWNLLLCSSFLHLRFFYLENETYGSLDLHLIELVKSIDSCRQNILTHGIYIFIMVMCTVKLFAGDIEK